ncbi:MAG TPA: hypothetical protein VND99_03040 [Candidatus Acidoferrales bacterium]|nr:hypothetical protein [Candidatus Acidoferrales bacterium]
MKINRNETQNSYSKDLPPGTRLSRGGLDRLRAAQRDGVPHITTRVYVRRAVELSGGNANKVGPFGRGSRAFQELEAEAKAARREASLKISPESLRELKD